MSNLPAPFAPLVSGGEGLDRYPAEPTALAARMAEIYGVAADQVLPVRGLTHGLELVFRLAATALVFVGAIVSAGLAWDTADMLQGTMVIINIPVILILGNKGVAVLKDYMRQRKEGKTPEFHAADIGITGTDYWN